MKFVLAALFLTGSTAFAFPEGTLRCKNGAKGLPDNVYRIESVQMGSRSLPFVHITRYIQDKGEVQEVNIQGMAAVSTLNNVESLSLAAIRIEFIDGVMTGCRQ